MRALAASDLLTVWEWGFARGPIERGLALLATACPDEPLDRLLHLRIGERDVQLARLRALTFGSQMECQVACPACGERLELPIVTADLVAIDVEIARVEAEKGVVHVEHDGWRVHFRSIETRDLLAIASAAQAGRARRELMNRCVLMAASPAGHETAGVPDEGLPPEVEAAVLAQMERADSASAIAMALSCPGCRHAWTAPFDILSFFWREIDAWACRTVREVHLLASAYGWSERDILGLSAWRRDAYLQMSGHA